MSDVVYDRMMYDHLEQVAARQDEAAYLRCQVQVLADDVERMRLTQAEREAIEWASKTLCVGWHDLAAKDKQRTRDAAATLQSLLGRIDATSTR